MLAFVTAGTPCAAFRAGRRDTFGMRRRRAEKKKRRFSRGSVWMPDGAEPAAGFMACVPKRRKRIKQKRGKGKIRQGTGDRSGYQGRGCKKAGREDSSRPAMLSDTVTCQNRAWCRAFRREACRARRVPHRGCRAERGAWRTFRDSSWREKHNGSRR